MSLPTPHDEFDAARLLVDVLKPLHPDERARAIRWAQEKLGVTNPPSLTNGTDDSRSAIQTGSSARTGHELTAALNDPAFLHARAAVDKMLYLLGTAYRLKPEDFDTKILSIGGRRRRYFAKSSKEILDSGRSTQPRNIPGTPYWVMTNSPTPQKAELLGRVLQLLEFSQNAVREAVATVI